ncbi:hypothetical protein PSHT_15732 [Puccinia striiformis]|uniref:Uncharacterized protein n=1 Tax=Puccinia striiformis TaxID=27350 RepID=A0A2S4UDC6_9BASI|nr:hypothetical protein PSHT_15732 [Puccinia striiformis]
MEEWTQNLMKSETRLFLERTEPPEEDADQMFTMQASGIMFQMLYFFTGFTDNCCNFSDCLCLHFSQPLCQCPD